MSQAHLPYVLLKVIGKLWRTCFIIRAQSEWHGTSTGLVKPLRYLVGVPKKGTKRKKIITEIEHCEVKFYYVHDLGGLAPA